MHHFPLMNVRKPSGNLCNDRTSIQFIQWSELLDKTIQVFAFNEFGDKVMNASVDSCVERSNKRLVIQTSQHPHFTTKRSLRILGCFLTRQHLQCHSAAQHQMFGKKHLPHAATSNLIEHHVSAEPKSSPTGHNFSSLKLGQPTLLNRQICQGPVPGLRFRRLEGLRTAQFGNK